jgi:tRNA pseudouridine38-40 synthase
LRIAIGIAYCGTGLQGWQSQPSGHTVQDNLERALSEIAGERVEIVGAGRTDAGVHAIAQVAHFETTAARPHSAWVRGANSLLPASIAVQWASAVSEEFHARYSARSRSYRYVIYNHSVRPALLAGLVGWFHLPLDVEKMRSATQCVLGEHDFSSFRSSECQARSPVRRMEEIRIRTRGPYLVLDFRANGFLHHMVRNLVGCLVYVGKGERSQQWLADVVAARDRRQGAPTFAAEGLYLSEVTYEARWDLPQFPRSMPFETDMPS